MTAKILNFNYFSKLKSHKSCNFVGNFFVTLLVTLPTSTSYLLLIYFLGVNFCYFLLGGGNGTAMGQDMGY